MPLIRKLIRIGHSQGVTLPSSWLEMIYRETGQMPTELAIEVNRVLKINAIINGLPLNLKGRQGREEEERKQRRKQIIEAKGNICENCGKKVILTYDSILHHIVPIKEGGSNDLENIRLLCSSCHTTLHRKVKKT